MQNDFQLLFSQKFISSIGLWFIHVNSQLKIKIINFFIIIIIINHLILSAVKDFTETSAFMDIKIPLLQCFSL